MKNLDTVLEKLKNSIIYIINSDSVISAEHRDNVVLVKQTNKETGEKSNTLIKFDLISSFLEKNITNSRIYS